MSASASLAAEDRLLTFGLGESLYALPIACVVEVTEIGALACVPGLPPDVGGVVNFHGDALPVLRRDELLGLAPEAGGEATHVLVVAPRPGGGARLGLPVDRIEGLVAGAGARATDAGPVAEQRPLGGRVVFVLDAERLVQRAREVIDTSGVRSD